MKILRFYIIKEHIGPFIFSTLVITIIFVLNHILKLMKLIVEKGLDVQVVFRLFLLMLPFIIVLTIPIGVLFATVLAFGRLSENSELIAVKSHGINLNSLIIPVLFMAGLISYLLMQFHNYILPETNHQMKDLLQDISRKRPAIHIREGVFIDDFKNLKIYIKKLDDKTDKIYDVTIEQLRENELPRTYIAKEGKIITTSGGGGLSIVLSQGEVDEINMNSPEKFRRLRFEEQIFYLELNTSMDHKESTIRGDREMSASMLKEKIMELEDKVSLDQKDLGNLLNDNSKKNEKEEKIKKSAIERLRIRIKSYKRDIDKYEVEYHKKYAISMACIVFILIGAPLGSIPKKGGTSIGIAIAIGIILFYYICLIAGEDLSDRGKVSPMLSMWIPNFLMSFVGIVLLRALTRGKITFPTDKIFEKIEKYRKK